MLNGICEFTLVKITLENDNSFSKSYKYICFSECPCKHSCINDETGGYYCENEEGLLLRTDGVSCEGKDTWLSWHYYIIPEYISISDLPYQKGQI